MATSSNADQLIVEDFAGETCNPVSQHCHEWDLHGRRLPARHWEDAATLPQILKFA
jgi:hypothetical protein